MLITFAQTYSGHRPGDTDEVDDALAAQLIHDGFARPAATKTKTVAEILEAVGDDRAKAAAALDAENARPNPRSTLVDQLSRLAGSPAGDGTTQGDPA